MGGTKLFTTPSESVATLRSFSPTHTPQYYDLAADVLAENAHLTYKCLSPYLYEFIDAKIIQQTSPEEVYIITFMYTLWPPSILDISPSSVGLLRVPF